MNSEPQVHDMETRREWYRQHPGEWSRRHCPKGWTTGTDLRRFMRIKRHDFGRLMYTLIAEWGKDDPCAPRKYCWGRNSRRTNTAAFWIVHETVAHFILMREVVLLLARGLGGPIETRRHRMAQRPISCELMKYLLHHDLRSRASGTRSFTTSRIRSTSSPAWLRKQRLEWK